MFMLAVATAGMPIYSTHASEIVDGSVIHLQSMSAAEVQPSVTIDVSSSGGSKLIPSLERQSVTSLVRLSAVGVSISTMTVRAATLR